MKSYMLVVMAALMLAGCSAKCNCPKCDKTTVVAPPSGTTVVTPE